jgi:hypothetical protein
MIQISGIARAASDFFDAVYQRNAAMPQLGWLSHLAAHEVASAAACTDSMIFTYPVQRQMLPASAALISAWLGRELRRNSASAAMIIPGVQKPHWVPSFS